ncbi:hypothetical protein BWZ22_09745 [Seonamhaeicola sp. S2-3]|uniref:hypothetical protein n=1 Tax=Seonamhaeicola sp. S2-3 TaxID=1936081 RepID=UPI000972AEA4|nr:hypothetical protein [Seonamhaeicola sp. S2-3]APY11509.1 hypothetical protein BWZ22_09745 [Seonamhaeicola sp. S2-3]
MSKIRYINFPIQLLKGFLIDDTKCLYNIMCYGCYTHSLKHDLAPPYQAFKIANKYFKIPFILDKSSFENGEELYNSIPIKSPKVGISIEMLLDFYNNYKEEFDKVCFLGFLALKSIVQNKTYCKVTNNYWISRMDGQEKVHNEVIGLSDAISKYNNEYQLGKIKKELILNWHLTHYSRYTRGFYVSFKLDLDSLVYEAEKRRKSTREKQLRFETQNAINKALNKIENR